MDVKVEARDELATAGIRTKYGAWVRVLVVEMWQSG